VLRGEGFEARTTEGGSGQFDVHSDGNLIFSKREQGRFPETDEILSALRDG
jgi:selT/selW/selH-like putative selenoprotein